MEQNGADDRVDLLLERAGRLVDAVERRSDSEPRNTTVKVDTRVDNRRSERAAWFAGTAAAVAMTIAILQAFQIHSLQGKLDRMQDYLNFIYQQAPNLRKPEQSK